MQLKVNLSGQSILSMAQKLQNNPNKKINLMIGLPQIIKMLNKKGLTVVDKNTIEQTPQIISNYGNADPAMYNAMSRMFEFLTNYSGKFSRVLPMLILAFMLLTILTSACSMAMSAYVLYSKLETDKLIANNNEYLSKNIIESSREIAETSREFKFKSKALLEEAEYLNNMVKQTLQRQQLQSQQQGLPFVPHR